MFNVSTGDILKDIANQLFTHSVMCRHFTREALPRLDNYRDILSVQAVYRPTLDDLHNATMSNKVTIKIAYKLNY